MGGYSSRETQNNNYKSKLALLKKRGLSHTQTSRSEVSRAGILELHILISVHRNFLVVSVFFSFCLEREREMVESAKGHLEEFEDDEEVGTHRGLFGYLRELDFVVDGFSYSSAFWLGKK